MTPPPYPPRMPPSPLIANAIPVFRFSSWDVYPSAFGMNLGRILYVKAIITPSMKIIPKRYFILG